LITFKESGSEAPGQYQAHVNRKAIGFWLAAESASEAENKLIEMAGETAGLRKELADHQAEKAIAIEAIQKQTDRLNELTETITKMKTEAPEPEKFNSRRLFRRW
jgi:hypothetical protein